MCVVISRFCVENGMSEEFREAFVNRPHKVDSEPGFFKMEVLQPTENSDEFWLITHWLDKQSWEQWYHSHSYKNSHQGIPSGLKLVPKSTEIKHFELLTN